MGLVAWFPFNKSLINKGETKIFLKPKSSANWTQQAGCMTSYAFFNNDTEYLEFTDEENVLDTTFKSEFSFSFFLKFSENGTRGIIFGNHQSSSFDTFNIEVNRDGTTSNQLRFYWCKANQAALDYLVPDFYFNQNVWVHCIITYDGSDIRFYRNGVLKDTKHVSLTKLNFSQERPFRIGNDNRGGNSVNLIGYFNDFRIYNHCLSKAEIRNLCKRLAVHYTSDDCYQPIEYIEFDGSMSYPLDRLRPSTRLKTEIVIEPNANTDDVLDERAIFGASWATNGYFLMFMYDTNNRSRKFIRFHSRGYVCDVTNFNKTGKNIIRTWSKSITDNILEVNGIRYKYTQNYTEANDSSNQIKLGSTPETGSSYPGNRLGKFRLYSFKAWNNDKLIYDIIPAVNMLDKSIGLYDRASGSFMRGTGWPKLNNVWWNVKDVSGHGLNATAQNTIMAGINSTKIGMTSLMFQGSGHIKQYSADSVPLMGNTFTVNTWARTSSLTTQCLFCDRNSTGEGPALFLIAGTNQSVRFDTGDQTLVNFNFADGEWHMYTLVYNDSDKHKYCYIDGNLVATNENSSIGKKGIALTIGASHPNGQQVTGNYLVGNICDWRLYFSALSAADIKDLYETRFTIDDGYNLSCDRLLTSSELNFTKRGILTAKSISTGADYINFSGKYKVLEYIRTDGNQYIDLDYYPKYSTVIEGEYANTENQVDTPLFGCRITQNNSVVDSYTLWVHPSDYKISSDSSQAIFNNSTVNFSRSTTHVSGWNRNTFYYSNSLIRINNETKTLSASNKTSTKKLVLFGLRTNDAIDGRKFIGNLYRFKITENNKEIFNFIPVKRTSDDVAGLYDTVHGVFYSSNDSTKPFIAPDVLEDSLATIGCKNFYPNGGASVANFKNYRYISLDYIQVSGDQWFDTGLTMNYNTDDVEITVQPTTSNQDGFFYGQWDANNTSQAAWYHSISSGGGGNTIKFWALVDNVYQGWPNGSYTYPATDVSKHTWKIAEKKVYVDGVVKQTVGSTFNRTSSYNVFIGAANGISGYGYKGKIYSCRMWKSGNLVRDFIPVQRICDASFGLYDKIEDKFYPNKGSGEFTPGNQKYLIE